MFDSLNNKLDKIIRLLEAKTPEAKQVEPIVDPEQALVIKEEKAPKVKKASKKASPKK